MTQEERIQKVVKEMRDNPSNVRFNDLVKVCHYYFGEPRHNGGSHKVYKMTWQGDPRVNIQEKKGKGKPYQVRQVLEALDKLQGE